MNAYSDERPKIPVLLKIAHRQAREYFRKILRSPVFSVQAYPGGQEENDIPSGGESRITVQPFENSIISEGRSVKENPENRRLVILAQVPGRRRSGLTASMHWNWPGDRRYFRDLLYIKVLELIKRTRMEKSTKTVEL